MRYYRITALFLSFSFLSISVVYAWTGKIIGVTDGDTIKVLKNGKQVKVRINGIDTPVLGELI